MLGVKVDFSNFIRRNQHLRKLFKSARVQVGYSHPKATYVHENTQMKLRGRLRGSRIGVYWGAIGGGLGSSKFLETPLREMTADGSLAKAIGASMRASLRQGGSGEPVKEGLMAGAEMLKDRSQEIVPVEYGDLRNSVYIK